jgi:hypothetical protein
MAYFHQPLNKDFYHNGCWYTRPNKLSYFTPCKDCYDTPWIGPSGVLDGRFDDYKYYGYVSGPPVTPDYGWNADTTAYTDVTGTTLAVADQKVAAWKSFGNNEVLFTQSTENLRPTLKQGVFGSLAKNALLFTASSSQFLWNDSKLLNSATGAVFAVIQYTTSPNNQYLLAMRGTTDDLAYWCLGTKSTTDYQYYLHRNNVADGSTALEYSGKALDTNTPHILAYIQDGSGQDFYQNGSEVTINTGTKDTHWTTNISANRTSIGALYGASASAYYNGYLAELLVYESTLTSDEISNIKDRKSVV